MTLAKTRHPIAPRILLVAVLGLLVSARAHAQGPVFLAPGGTDSTTRTIGQPGTLTTSTFFSYWSFNGVPPSLSGTQVGYPTGVTASNPAGGPPSLSNANASAGYTLASGSAASGGGNLGLAGAFPMAVSGGTSPGFNLGMQSNPIPPSGPPNNTPPRDFMFKVNSVQFGSRSAATGPTTVVLRSDFDNYGQDLGSSSVAANGAWQAIDFSPTMAPTRLQTLSLFGLGGSGTAASNWQIDDLRIAGTLYEFANMSLGSGTFGIQGPSPGAVTFAGGFNVTGVAIFTPMAGGTVTVSGPISGLQGSVANLAPGTLVLTASNSYAMDTRIGAGTVRAENVNAFGTSTVFVNDAATLDLGNLPITNRLVFKSTATILNSGSYAGPLVVAQGAAVNYQQAISGSMTIAQGGQASFNGGFAGRLDLTGSAAFNQAMSGSVALAAGGVAAFNGPVPGFVALSGSGAVGTFSGPISGRVMPSSGAVGVISGTVDATADVSVGPGGRVQFGPGFTFQPAALPNQGTLDLAGSGSASLAASISGSGSLVASGSGVTALSGSSSFTGGTWINAGGLAVTNPFALGQGQVSIANGGRLIIDTTLALGGSNAVVLAAGAELQSLDGGSAPIAAGSALGGVTTSGSGSLPASAALLAGVASGSGGLLATDWTTAFGKPANAVSEVLDLHTPTGSAPFVLSMSYDPAAVSGTTAGGPWLLWDSGSNGWVNAVDGNVPGAGLTLATAGMLGFEGSFATFQNTEFAGVLAGSDVTKYLGAYGRDAATHTVWAVVNHNSLFGGGTVVAVPEPATLAMAAGAAVLLGGAWARRRGRRRQRATA